MRPRKQEEERTSFQEAGPYDPRTDSRADVAMVYGLNPSFEERVARWREAGYRVHVMTGVSWGGYQDYVRGEWDGVPHFDDAQAASGGFKLEHGISQGHDIYYMMPSMSYVRYLAEKLRRVVEAGALAIHLEEPEFWVRAGYSEGFQREWREYYGEEWQDPASSPDAQYRASRLKQHLYTRALAYLCADLKQCAAGRGNPQFKCYVPTHSLLNYAHWRIVSPESRMLALPECDGLIGQVWTGTSRTPTVYAGVHKQRTLEAGYCEYAACTALVRGTDKRLWQLADPIEDNPNYCWEDYRANWEGTVTGSLLVADSERFEIMPWPGRVFTRTYPTLNLVALPLAPLLEKYLARLQREGQAERLASTRRAFDQLLEFYGEHGEETRKETLGFADLADRGDTVRFGDLWSAVLGFYRELASWPDQQEAQKLRDAVAAFYHDPTDQRSAIPEEYATELQVVFNALADMHWPGDTQWLRGQTGVGLGISDTLMFQRGDPDPSDADLSSLYGLALPLVKHGVALSMVQLERVQDVGYLDGVEVLVLSYEGQKPTTAAIHQRLAGWVRNGGGLVLCGQGDAYDRVREWWNQDGSDYARPQEHLCELLGLGRRPAAGLHRCGTGCVVVDPASPAALAHDPQGPTHVLERVRQARQALGQAWQEGNALVLRRGPYVVAAGMDEVEGEPPVLPGTYVDLFDARLAIHRDPIIRPDTRWLLYDLSRCPAQPRVIAAAGRVREESGTGRGMHVVVEGMAGTIGTARVRLPADLGAGRGGGAASAAVAGQSAATEVEPTAIGRSVASGIEVKVEITWHASTGTVLLRFANEPAGVAVELGW